MESLFSAAKVFSYANEQKGDATKAIDDVFCLQLKFFRTQMSKRVMRQRLLMTCLDSPCNFCVSCSVGRSKGIPSFRLAQAHGITGLVFSPARLLHLIELVCVRAL